MDTSDPDIAFDNCGVCSHCHTYEEVIQARVFSGAEGQRKVERIARIIKKAGKGKAYDCVIGLSGGVDSSFVACKTKELGLRPLAVHLDNGWDSELAAKNIENIVKRLKIDLYTHVIDWEEFKDLQLAFLKASTPDSEIPSDHAIMAIMYQTARRIGVKHVISGYNAKTESHLPRAWSQGYADWTYIKSIHKLYGRVPLKTFPHMNELEYFRYRLSMDFIDILNYVDYVKNDAKNLLINDLCWKDYGRKHNESIYTRFYQAYILPRKFGFDKRRSHLSSLICSGEITRANALEELTAPPCTSEMATADKEYVVKKLGLTQEMFEQIMNLPKRTIADYPSSRRLFDVAGAVFRYYKYRIRERKL
jgi:N-acetyl sugar amidotransferase